LHFRKNQPIDKIILLFKIQVKIIIFQFYGYQAKNCGRKYMI
jgi:hypothetical protein